MRKPLAASIIFAALSCAVVAAQERITVRWHRVTPETEAFGVLMPETPLRVRRVIPFSEELKLETPVYEVTYRGILFSVLSIAKQEVAALRTFKDFENGLRYAVQHSSRAGNSEFNFERKVTLDNQPARQYLVRAEGKEGTAQVYETATHYYVLMTLGARASELLAGNFFNSFTLDTKGARDASDKVSISQDFTPQPSAPEPLWPVAGLKSAVGPTKSKVPPWPYGPPAPCTKEKSKNTARLPISGGILNGKALDKPQPVYPPVAIAARAQGVVTVQVTVDEDGYVIAAEAVAGHPLLQQASVKAARQIRFPPTCLAGEPVKVQGVVTYNFVLN